MTGDTVIENSQLALQRAHLGRINLVLIFKNVDLDAQIVPGIAQVNQYAVRRHPLRRLKISHFLLHVAHAPRASVLGRRSKCAGRKFHSQLGRQLLHLPVLGPLY